MNWRIEHADALSLLRELPDNWAQTCITSPPSTSALARVLAVVAEVRRVLREDGTLWLLLERGEPLVTRLRAEGWSCQQPPRWATPLTGLRGTSTRLFLLTRERRYFYNAHTSIWHTTPQRPSCQSTSRQTLHVQGCVPVRERSLQLVKRCVLVSSSLLACGACGAPYRRTQPGESTPGIRRPTCPHNNPNGRCLVLDPFYHPGIPTAEAAHRHGRSFLGITDTARIGEHP